MQIIVAFIAIQQQLLNKKKFELTLCFKGFNIALLNEKGCYTIKVIFLNRLN